MIYIFKTIPSRLWITEFLISFEYETKRGNKKKQTRKMKSISQEMVKRDFYIWLDYMREKEPHRAMLNVNILSIEECGGEYIKFNDRRE